MRTCTVRVRKMPPVRFMALAFAVALTAYITLTFTRGDPIEAVIEAKEAEPITKQITFEPLRLYALCTAHCESEENAAVEAERYLSRGSAGYIVADGTRHILCAGYETADEAETVAERLKGEGIETDVMHWQSEPVELSVTAAREQIEALTECEQCLRETTVLIGALSRAVSKREISVAQALHTIASQRADMTEKERSLIKAAGGQPDDKVCAPLIALSDEENRALGALADCDDISSETLFSGCLRKLFLGFRLSHIGYLQRLAA